MNEQRTLILGKDGKKRCFGSSSLYQTYHDQEWGIPNHEDRYLFEMLILENAQAGLNWETILKRREGYRELFHQFDAKKVACMTDEELEKVCLDPRIIRHRLKIYSTRKNAHIFLQIQKEQGSFSKYLWAFVDHKPLMNHWKTLQEIPSSSPISEALSKDLKKRGMSFVGSTIMYAYMQAVGLVHDHVDGCDFKKAIF